MISRYSVKAACLVVASVVAVASSAAFAAPIDLLGVVEQDAWSDLVFTNTTVDYDAGTGDLTITNGTEATQLEIGPEFGPGNPGNHYGAGGTLGGLGGGSPIQASLSVTGVQLDPNGVVTNGGSLVVTYVNPPNGTFAGDITDDYGINSGAALVTGTIEAVLLGATGATTLDVLYQVTGGALQNNVNSEPSLAGIPFASSGYGILRMSAATPSLPADWSASFTSQMANNDVFGVPEPGTVALALVSGVFVLGGRRRK